MPKRDVRRRRAGDAAWRGYRLLSVGGVEALDHSAWLAFGPDGVEKGLE